MLKHYILKTKRPVQCNNLKKWGKYFTYSPDRLIKHTYIKNIFVSTVFLGIDHAFFNGKPILYETMIFNLEPDYFQKRYCTREQAKRGHNYAIKYVLEYLKRKRVSQHAVKTIP